MRPCWLGVLVSRWWCGAGGKELVARLVVGLVLHRFFDIFGRLGHEKSLKIAESTHDAKDS